MPRFAACQTLLQLFVAVILCNSVLLHNECWTGGYTVIQHRLVKLREQFGLSQEELADRLHLSRGQLSMYEIGKRRPAYEILIAMADFFGVTTDYLLGRTNDPKGVVRDNLTEWERVLFQSMKMDIEKGLDVETLRQRYHVYDDGKLIDAEEWRALVAFLRTYRSLES